MPSQLVFLVDLDQCLPLQEELEEADLQKHLSGLRQLCLKLMCSASALDVNGLKTKVDMANFGLKFYSSTGYFSVAKQLTGPFNELSKETFDSFDADLSERFEHIVQTSKTNLFDSSSLKKHIESESQRISPAESLRKALEEIALLYNWDRPVLNSPVKRNNRDHPHENIVYVFTRFPSTKEELRRFMGATRISHRDVAEEVAMKSNQVVKVFKEDANISVFGIDTTAMYDTNVSVEKTVKDTIHRALKTSLKGGLISITAFNGRVAVSAVLETYRLEAANPMKSKHSRNKCEWSFQEDNMESLQTFVRSVKGLDRSNCHPAKLKVLGFIDSTAVPQFPVLEEHRTVWSTDNGPNLVGLFSFIAKTRRQLLFRQDEKIYLLASHDQQSAILSEVREDLSDDWSRLLALLPSNEEQPKVRGSFQEGVIKQALNDVIGKDASVERKEKVAASQRPRFDADSLEHWKVPESKPFEDLFPQMEKQTQERQFGPLYKKIKQFYDNKRTNLPAPLPAPAIRSKNERVELLLDRKPRPRAGAVLDNRRSSVELSRRISTESVGSSASSRRSEESRKFAHSRGANLRRLGYRKNEEKRQKQEIQAAKVLEERKERFEKRKKTRQDVEKELCKHLNEKKKLIDVIKAKIKFLVEQGGRFADCDDRMVVYVQSIVNVLLRHLQAMMVPKVDVEPLLVEHFLKKPQMKVQARNTDNLDARTRDHLFQLLIRFELVWLVANETRKAELYEEIVEFLRCVSIEHNNNNPTLRILNDVLTPEYMETQHEMLHQLYEELMLPIPDVLQDDDDTASEAPSSVLSSEASSSVVFSYRQQPLGSNPSTSGQQQFNVRKMKGRPMSRDAVRQIDLKPKGNKPAAKIVIKRHPSAKKSKPVASTNAKAVRAKRNLMFGDKSPRKKATPRKKEPLPRTPKKMTPMKTHQILAPETPKRDARRKSDGVLTVTESPDIDAIKGAKTTPRRMGASMALRKKTAFYSGNVSRNLLKAEENINAERISQPLQRSQSFLDEGSKTISSSTLFPHLNRKRKRSESMDEENVAQPVPTTPKKPPGTPHKTPRKELPDEEDMFSPSKRVQFNMQPQPPTPSRKIAQAKGILKTPCKHGSTPAKATAVKRTPHKSSSASKLLFQSPTKMTPKKTPMKSPTKDVSEGLFVTPEKRFSSPRRKSPKVILTPLKTDVSHLPSTLDEATTHEDQSRTPPKLATPSKSPNKRAFGLDKVSDRTIFVPRLIKRVRRSLGESSTKPEVHRTRRSLRGVPGEIVEMVETDDPVRETAKEEAKTEDSASAPSMEGKAEENEAKVESRESPQKSVEQKAPSEEQLEEIPVVADETNGEPEKQAVKNARKGRRRLRSSLDETKPEVDKTPEKPVYIPLLPKLITPIRKTPNHDVTPGKDLGTPDRPSRSRKLTHRLGIDDITLSEAVSPVGSGKKRKASEHFAASSPARSEERDEVSLESKRQVLQFPPVKPSPKRSRSKSHKSPKVQRIKISNQDESAAVMQDKRDIPEGELKRRVSEWLPAAGDMKGTTGASNQDDWTLIQTKSPLVIKIERSSSVSSPLNRSVCSNASNVSFSEAASSTASMRISRRMTKDTGISPTKLLSLMKQSPSPKKKVRTEEQTPSKSLQDKENEGSTGKKLTPLSQSGLRQLTEAPLQERNSDNRKGRKVNKRLQYNDK